MNFINKAKKEICFYSYLAHTVSQRSDPGTAKIITSKIKRDKSQVIVSHHHHPQRKRTPSNYSATNGDSSDEPDIMITRL